LISTSAEMAVQRVWMRAGPRTMWLITAIHGGIYTGSRKSSSKARSAEQPPRNRCSCCVIIAINRHAPRSCNHCDKPPCAQVCPVRATYKRDDGIVIVDHHRCIGCRYCMIACPYNARQFNFKDNEDWPNQEHPKRSHGVAEACNLCAHRLDVGKMPACVEACGKSGAGALFVGDLNDPDSDVSRLISGNTVKRIREDLGTEPKVYYIGL